MLRYVALGDSITAGEKATMPNRAYPSLIVQQAQIKAPSSWAQVLAAPGWTSGSLNMAVLDNSDEYLLQCSVVSIWIGGDDLGYAALRVAEGAPKATLMVALRKYREHLQQLIQYVRQVCTSRLVVCTQYNPFPNSQIAVEGIQALNDLTTRIAAANGAVIAPMHEVFAGQQANLIAGYRTGRVEDVLISPSLPIHPNNLGHLQIAKTLYPLLVTV